MVALLGALFDEVAILDQFTDDGIDLAQGERWLAFQPPAHEAIGVTGDADLQRSSATVVGERRSVPLAAAVLVLAFVLLWRADNAAGPLFGHAHRTELWIVAGTRTRGAQPLLARHRYTGNIRELQNIIERAAVLTPDQIIHLENLPVVFAELTFEMSAAAEDGGEPDFRRQREKHLGQVEKNLLKRYLKEAGGNVSEAARQARIPRRTFYRLLARHGLRGADYQS